MKLQMAIAVKPEIVGKKTKTMILEYSLSLYGLIHEYLMVTKNELIGKQH